MKKRIAMEGWTEEKFMAYYRLGKTYQYLNDWDNALKYHLKAFSFRPHRAEPLMYIAQHYWDNNDAALSFLFAQRAAQIPYPANDYLFIEKEIYSFYRYDLLGRVAWFVQEYRDWQERYLKSLRKLPEMNLICITI